MDVGSISVVVPVYQSEASLPALLDRLHPMLTRLGRPFEVILVNDGSRDRSWDVITDLAARWPGVRGINLSRNYGQHNALLCGIRAAGHEIVVTMDDDLQHPPEELPRILEPLSRGFDVVYGTPEHQQHGLMRDMASTVTKVVLQSVMGSENARNVSAFRAFRTSLRDAFTDFRSPWVSIDVLLTWGTTRFTAVPVRHDPRTVGVSHYTIGKLVAHAINMFTGYSTVPLRLASYLGFGCTLLGLLTMAWVLLGYLIYGRVQPGFAFLASIIAIFAGAQMFALGIMGEYMARVHFRLMEKPPYVIHSRRDGPDDWREAA